MAKKKSSIAKIATPPSKQSLDDFLANWSDDDDDESQAVKPVVNGNAKTGGMVPNGAKKGPNGAITQNGKGKPQNGKVKPQNGKGKPQNGRQQVNIEY